MAFFWFRRAPSLLLEKFKGIYSVQSQGRAFRSPVELLEGVGLMGWTQQDMRSAIQVGYISLVIKGTEKTRESFPPMAKSLIQ